MDLCPELQTTLVGLVHFVATVDEHGEVLHADLVIAVLAAVRLT
jgi:hypothetical protein